MCRMTEAADEAMVPPRFGSAGFAPAPAHRSRARRGDRTFAILADCWPECHRADTRRPSIMARGRGNYKARRAASRHRQQPPRVAAANIPLELPRQRRFLQLQESRLEEEDREV